MALDFVGDPEAEVDYVSRENAQWIITVSGHLAVHRSRPAGALSPRPEGWHRVRIAFDADDPDRRVPVTVETFDPYY
jgi:hypothetical protein